MPNVTIYIRNDDYEAWNRIANKPEWIHERLNISLVTVNGSVYAMGGNATKRYDSDIEPTYTNIEETL